MNRRWFMPFVILPGAMLSAAAASSATPEAVPGDFMKTGQRIDLRADVAGDTVVAGRTINISGRIGDTLIAAGRRLSIGGAVRNDAILAGETVRISGAIGDNLFAAGRLVAIDGRIGGKAIAAGARISLGPGAIVAEDARLAGDTLILAGTVARSARLSGNDVRIDGTIRGDAHVEANHVRLGRTARIGGTLTVESAAPPTVAPGAVVTGGISYRQPESMRRGLAERILAQSISVIVLLIGLWIIGVILLLLGPNFVRDLQRSLTTRLLACLGVGLLIAIASLPFALLLLATVVGLPFAFGVLSANLFALGTAVPFFGLAVARIWAERQTGAEPTRGALLVRLAVALLVIVLLGMIPIVGALLWIGTGLLGMGAAGLALFERWRGRRGPGNLPRSSGNSVAAA